LQSINEQLNSSHETITQLQIQLERRTKWIYLLGSLCVLRLLLFVLGIVLYIKGVKVPRWLDIIL
jgi:hypothetical protein